MSENGNIILENREKLSVTAVKDVESFDERKIVLKTEQCRLIIEGSGLKIFSISIDSAEAVITGFINSCVYAKGSRGSFWGKLTK